RRSSAARAGAAEARLRAPERCHGRGLRRVPAGAAARAALAAPRPVEVRRRPRREARALRAPDVRAAARALAEGCAQRRVARRATSPRAAHPREAPALRVRLLRRLLPAPG